MITDIHLENFRSYTNESFEFTGGVNIIVGPNASGKTNLLESILLICRGKSYRAKDLDLMRYKKPWLRLEAHTDNNFDRIVYMNNDADTLKKEFEINSQHYKRLPFAKTIPVVLFEPNDLTIISGSPEKRRQFLDNILEQTVVGFASTGRRYKQALAQRNALLKQNHQTGKQLFVWDIQLSELGSKITDQRKELIKTINNLASNLYNNVTGGTNKVLFEYNSSVTGDDYASKLIHLLEEDINIDQARGFTGHGPHRDELTVYLNKHKSSESASRGELRTLMLVCKFIEAELLKMAREESPLLLLDDVFSELDGSRRKSLTTFLKTYQTFITTTDADVVIQHFTESANIIALG
ncbi:MAG TPA: DNA replication and repair protein RecF [Candidatus Saccharimonadales bacterium]|jgi:DNA replication and repair protein RecF|nr:DNA replication and repair protein RecF [Candidatus Saccharimonadales bacterium]